MREAGRKRGGDKGVGSAKKKFIASCVVLPVNVFE
jgi:hypothetical protein